ncbi:MAG: MEKHLA domain-containing protein, partial [Kiritimatiellae bacterium]|nr:MEKHLA domain-containing protein [Kiritimatiellia bacterium]
PRPDPVFQYGNRAALNLFELSRDAFLQLPSRFSAEPGERAAREAVLQEVCENGFSDHYSGVRVSSSGKRFRIEQATLWNLVDAKGDFRGQAATFSDWTRLDDPSGPSFPEHRTR